jgi:cytochrome c-type biogenesis protein CcmF
MSVLGAAALWLAVAFAVLGILMWARSRARGETPRGRAARLARLSAQAMAFCVLTAVGVLWILLLEEDYGVAYVAEETSRSLPILYRFTALWSGNAGSLLFWLAVLSVYVGLLAREGPDEEAEVLRFHALPFLLGTGLFYLGLVTLVASPFAPAPPHLYDGVGMNALLQNGWMVAHPPLLYTGFVGMAVPFSLAMAAVLTGKTDSTWVRLGQKTATFSWLVLGVGILLGAHWAYIELGWGGYWAWDPVENASLLPWLTATALLHGFLVQERRPVMRLWNVALAAGTYWLTMLGTFLTRSGIVDSVHAFTGTNMGIYFGPFVALGTVATGWFVYERRDVLLAGRLGSDEVRRPKETALLLNNLLFVFTVAGVLFGTFFPLLSGLVSPGHALAFQTQAYNRMVTPLAVGGFILLGATARMDWGWDGAKGLVGRLAFPALVALAVGVAVQVWGGGSLTASSVCASTAFALLALGGRWLEDARRRGQATGRSLAAAAWEVLTHGRRRYGAHLVHVAVLLAAVGIAASSVYGREAVLTLSPGQGAQIGQVQLRYQGLGVRFVGDRQVLAANLVVREAPGQGTAVLHPSQILYPNMSQPVAGVAIQSTWTGDLYAVLQAVEPQGPGGPLATLDVFVNPWVNLLWLGGILFLLGGLTVYWPARASQRAAQAQRPGVAA